MKADLTRDTFDARNHFRQVLAQQGRVQLDADYNEQSALGARRDETITADLAGHCGGPADAAAFGMSAIAGQPGDFLLSAGRYYVDGIQCELEAPINYRKQPDLPGLPVLPAGPHLVYLDVWQRHLTFLDDQRLLETALGGVDTTTRVKTVWQVRSVPVSGTPQCSTAYEEYTALTRASTIKLTARAERIDGADDPCQMEEASGYKSLENQLYRVEIHSLQTAAEQARGVGRAAVWKWSRENASVEVELKAVDVAGKKLTVASLGRDEKLGLRKGHFVELTDDAIELSGRHGDLIEVIDVDEGDLTITLKVAPSILTTVNPARHPRVRRWEGTANIQTNPWLELEAGIQVKFADVNLARPGDYWQIPARTSAPGAQAGTIEWPHELDASGQPQPEKPLPLPPRGIRHHYCRLGFVTVGVGPVFTDCRCLWPALTGVPRLFYLSGDGQEVMPRGALNKLRQPLIAGIANAHCAEGARLVRFTVVAPGTGRVAAAGGPLATRIDIPINPAGEARCEFHLDAVNYSQQVRAELLDAAGVPVLPALHYNASLSIASEVGYDSKCKGLGAASTVQDAISLLAAAARVSAVGGDGQDGFAGQILPLPLRVAVVSTCGPIQKAEVVFKGRIRDGADKDSAGLFALKPTDPFVPEVTAPTGADGIAAVFWQLPKQAQKEATFEAIAEVTGFAGNPPEGPREVCFTANLRTSGNDGDAGAVRIRALKFQKKELVLDGFFALSDLAGGIDVYFEGSAFAPWLQNQPIGNSSLPSSRVCCLTAEVPYPIGRNEQADVRDLIERTQAKPPVSELPAERVVGFRPLVLSVIVLLAGEDGGKPAHLFIQPERQTLRYLEAVLKSLKAVSAPEQILIRVQLKGNFIFGSPDDGEPTGWLDGDAFADLRTAQLILPSGDRRRGSDFEMWFWLATTKSKVSDALPKLTDVVPKLTDVAPKLTDVAPKLTDVPKLADAPPKLTDAIKGGDNILNPANPPAITKAEAKAAPGGKTRKVGKRKIPAKGKAFIRPEERPSTDPGKKPR